MKNELFLFVRLSTMLQSISKITRLLHEVMLSSSSFFPCEIARSYLGSFLFNLDSWVDN